MPKKKTARVLATSQVLLRISKELRAAIANDAASRKPSTTVQAVIIEVLGSHYGIDAPPPTTGRPMKPEE